MHSKKVTGVPGIDVLLGAEAYPYILTPTLFAVSSTNRFAEM